MYPQIIPYWSFIIINPPFYGFQNLRNHQLLPGQPFLGPFSPKPHPILTQTSPKHHHQPWRQSPPHPRGAATALLQPRIAVKDAGQRAQGPSDLTPGVGCGRSREGPAGKLVKITRDTTRLFMVMMVIILGITTTGITRTTAKLVHIDGSCWKLPALVGFWYVMVMFNARLIIFDYHSWLTANVLYGCFW